MRRISYNTARARGATILLLATLPLWLPLHAAYALDANWRAQAKDYIRQGKTEAAAFTLGQAQEHLMQEYEASDRIQTLRYLGEGYWLLGQRETARDYFREAMDQALDLREPWRRLAQAIAVAELQAKTVKEPEGRRDLLQRWLDAGLMTAAAADPLASDFGRFVRCFDKAADRHQAAELLGQIRRVARADIRKKALTAFADIALDPRDSGYISLEDRPAYDADALEQLLWHLAMAKTLDDPLRRVQAQAHLDQAVKLLERVDKAQRSRARRWIERAGINT